MGFGLIACFCASSTGVPQGSGAGEYLSCRAKAFPLAVLSGSMRLGAQFRLHVNNTNTDYFTGTASGNPDGNTHARVEAYLVNSTLVSFEDLFNGPFDYNDLSFSFTNTIAVDPVGETPIPGALPLFASGLGALGLISYRRKRKQSR